MNPQSSRRRPSKRPVHDGGVMRGAATGRRVTEDPPRWTLPRGPGRRTSLVPLCLLVFVPLMAGLGAVAGWMDRSAFGHLGEVAAHVTWNHADSKLLAISFAVLGVFVAFSVSRALEWSVDDYGEGKHLNDGSDRRIMIIGAMAGLARLGLDAAAAWLVEGITFDLARTFIYVPIHLGLSVVAVFVLTFGVVGMLQPDKDLVDGNMARFGDTLDDYRASHFMSWVMVAIAVCVALVGLTLVVR